MASPFQSFDRSPAGAFIRSPLGARGAGGVVETCFDPARRPLNIMVLGTWNALAAGFDAVWDADRALWADIRNSFENRTLRAGVLHLNDPTSWPFSGSVVPQGESLPAGFDFLGYLDLPQPDTDLAVLAGRIVDEFRSFADTTEPFHAALDFNNCQPPFAVPYQGSVGQPLINIQPFIEAVNVALVAAYPGAMITDYAFGSPVGNTSFPKRAAIIADPYCR